LENSLEQNGFAVLLPNSRSRKIRNEPQRFVDFLRWHQSPLLTSLGASALRSGCRASTEDQQNTRVESQADHRQVEQWFEAFEKTKSNTRKQDLAGRICEALTVHTVIEHHVEEEEQGGGMFAQAKQSDMDLAALGAKMASRRKELMATEG
jgi:hypothetical protein